MFAEPLVNGSNAGNGNGRGPARHTDNDGFVEAGVPIAQEHFEFDSSEVGCMYNFNEEEFTGGAMVAPAAP